MHTPVPTGTVLDRILEARRAEVEHRKQVLPETALKYGVAAATPLRDFSAALTRPGLNVLAELKPASPSRGVLREPFDPVALATSLESAGAAALSVLTEGEFFRGTLKNLRDARKSIQIPVLRKDFNFRSVAGLGDARKRCRQFSAHRRRASRRAARRTPGPRP